MDTELQLMSIDTLASENRQYAGTTGISQNNRSAGFLPAFCDLETLAVEPSRFASGAMAPVHVLDGLPAEWIVSRDDNGRVRSLKGSVIAGFLRDGRFYTREQAAQLLH
jgi:hypothetical protein